MSDEGPDTTPRPDAKEARRQLQCVHGILGDIARSLSAKTPRTDVLALPNSAAAMPLPTVESPAPVLSHTVTPTTASPVPIRMPEVSSPQIPAPRERAALESKIAQIPDLPRPVAATLPALPERATALVPDIATATVPPATAYTAQTPIPTMPGRRVDPLPAIPEASGVRAPVPGLPDGPRMPELTTPRLAEKLPAPVRRNPVSLPHLPETGGAAAPLPELPSPAGRFEPMGVAPSASNDVRHALTEGEGPAGAQGGTGELLQAINKLTDKIGELLEGNRGGKESAPRAMPSLPASGTMAGQFGATMMPPRFRRSAFAP